MKVVEQKTIFHKNGDVTKVRDDDSINIGKKMLRKVENGKLLICITCEGNRLQSVKSFAFHNYYRIPVEYLMYPVLKENGSIEVWSDSFTYLEEEDILYDWLSVHPEIIVDDQEENMKNRKYRMFVDV